MENRIKLAFRRNSLIIMLVFSTLLAVIQYTIYIIVLLSFLRPKLIGMFSSIIPNSPLSNMTPQEIFLYILSNNTGHYWNPLRMLVWIPLFGAFLLGFEILINGAVIGTVAALVGLKYNSALVPIAGLIPHGIIEIPAFVFQLAAVVRWQIVSCQALLDFIQGKKSERRRLKQDLVDVVILSLFSIALFVVAAVIETFIPPYLIELAK